MNGRGNDRKPSPENQEKLLLSQQEIEGLEAHNLICPYCGYWMCVLYEDRQGHMGLKCPKCKNIPIFNLAYFRRQRAGHTRLYLAARPKQIR